VTPDRIFDEQTEAILHKITMESFRDYVARILSPSPFDFRGRHLMTKEEAEWTADKLIERMNTMPDKGIAFMNEMYRESIE
jgi:hypothetical protein